MSDYALLAAGIAAGAVITGLWSRGVWLKKILAVEKRAASAESTLVLLKEQQVLKEGDIVRLNSCLNRVGEEKIQAETRLEEYGRRFGEQNKILQEAQERFTGTFRLLSAEALQRNNENFLDLAKSRLDTVFETVKGDLGKRQEAISGSINPLKEMLDRYQNQVTEIENTRREAYGRLNEQIEMLNRTHRELFRETGSLVQALKAPQVKGRWGEITLQRVVEVAGMSRHCDFVTQLSVQTGEGRLRPDMIVKLPGDRTVVVDAKVSLKAYLEAMDCQEEEKRRFHQTEHARQVRKHMVLLAAKNYWDQFQPSPDFVVLFLPGESFFSAALEIDGQLIEDGMNMKVILATPTTLISLLRTVAFAWQQQHVAENARIIAESGSELYERLARFAEHLGRVHGGLDLAVRSYNQAVGSWNSRVLPGARRMRELGVAGRGREVEEIGEMETRPKQLPAE